jgi:hypothetical protein
MAVNTNSEMSRFIAFLLELYRMNHLAYFHTASYLGSSMSACGTSLLSPFLQNGRKNLLLAIALRFLIR